MAESLTRDIRYGVSKAVETSYNTPYTAAADFWGAFGTGAFTVPNVGKITDAGKVGNQSEASNTVRNDYWEPTGLEIADELNTEIAAYLARRAFGGTSVNAALTASQSYSHAVPMATSGSKQLPPSTIVSLEENYDLILPGCVVNQFSITQEKTASPERS